MLEQILRLFVALLLACLVLPGCSHFSKTARQQRSYERYVRKTSGKRQKQKVKYAKSSWKIPRQNPSEPKITAHVDQSPQSVSSSESQANQ